MNTPSHHRVHHGRNPQYLDRNYGGIFIVWDRVFGTFEEEREKVVYGVEPPLGTINPIVVFFHGFARPHAKMRAARRRREGRRPAAPARRTLTRTAGHGAAAIFPAIPKHDGSSTLRRRRPAGSGLV